MLSRRRFLRDAGAATLLAGEARAEDFPTKPVHVYITTAPGGTSDLVSRLTSAPASDKLGKPFVIDNRPGAGGNIAALSVFREPADGHAVLSISKGNILANLLYDKLEFDFMRDFEPVSTIANGALLMLAHPSIPAKTLPEFVAWAKANPGKVNYGTPGTGSDPHLSGELFKMLAGVEMTHVPYRGGALALTDLIGGNVQLMFSNLPVNEFLANGKLRAYGVTTTTRAKDFPDLPAIAEFVPGFEVGAWYAYVVRKGTPPAIVAALNGAFNAGLADPKVVAALATQGLTPLTLPPAGVGQLFAKEFDKWSKVIHAANIKME